MNDKVTCTSKISQSSGNTTSSAPNDLGSSLYQLPQTVQLQFDYAVAQISEFVIANGPLQKKTLIYLKVLIFFVTKVAIIEFYHAFDN